MKLSDHILRKPFHVAFGQALQGTLTCGDSLFRSSQSFLVQAAGLLVNRVRLHQVLEPLGLIRRRFLGRQVFGRSFFWLYSALSFHAQDSTPQFDEDLRQAWACLSSFRQLAGPAQGIEEKR